ncbi:MAG: DNA polymerase III subunit delta' [Hylemonella sp.]|nr:DNA polymerase III subunit delta' [Hylemonella sp.]
MNTSSELPPWIARQASLLLAQRGHAWLLQGPSGLGQYGLALALVRGWLCESPLDQLACGRCASCHAIDVHTHADLYMLMPETTMLELGWPLDEKAQADIDDKKRKPSREIRIDAMRQAVEFSQRTSARGKGKAVLVFPAERMNHVTANALLKTLEEPPGELRFALASEASHQLLPTLRSRCQTHTMAWPSAQEASDWLLGQGIAQPDIEVWLRAAGGRPDDALRLAAQGRKPADWRGLPRAVLRGDGSCFDGWSPALVIDALQKLCHDLSVTQQGGQPRYFSTADLPPPPSIRALTQYSQELVQACRHAEHPFNAGLMLEALVSRAQIALHSGQ